jgi:prefoldin subunit 5
MMAEVETLKQDLQGIRGVSDKLRETEKILSSVDASRQQLVQRVVELERRLGDLQRKAAQGSPKPAAGGLQVEVPGAQ